jgi:hypothetical protein
MQNELTTATKQTLTVPGKGTLLLLLKAGH